MAKTLAEYATVLFDENFIKLIEPNTQFVIEERKAEGLGKCFFKGSGPVLLIRARDQAPVLWCLKNRKCAEAAFLISTADGLTHLHIVEIKSKLGLKEYKRVIEQWQGMYLSSLAVLTLANIDAPSSVTVYVAFTEEKLQTDPSQLILSKPLVGGQPILPKSSWNDGIIDLCNGVKANICKGLRTPDYDFGSVGAP